MVSATGLIAKEPRPSEATVKRHLAIVYQEVGVHSSNAVVRAALVGQRAATEPTPLLGLHHGPGQQPVFLGYGDDDGLPRHAVLAFGHVVGEASRALVAEHGGAVLEC